MPSHHAQGKEVDEGSINKGGGRGGGHRVPQVTQSGAGDGVEQEAGQVFSGYRGLSLWDWQKLILCGYISSQLNQITFAFKTF